MSAWPVAWDFGAWARSVRGYGLTIARAILRDDALAEDALQEALLRTWRGCPSGGDAEQLKPWFGCVIRNVSVDMKRRRRRRRALSLDATTQEGARIQIGVLASTEAFDAREACAVFLRALRATKGKARHARALDLVALRGLAVEEAARRMGVGGGAVKMLVHRAREHARATGAARRFFGASE